MLQSIKRALKLKSEDPRLHSCLVRFQFFFEKNEASLPGPVKEVILAEGQEIFSFKSAQERNEEFMQKYSHSLEHRVIGAFSSFRQRAFHGFLQCKLILFLGAKMLALLEPGKTKQVIEALVRLDGATPLSLKVIKNH